MAFIDRVQDLTSLTVSDTDELSQFLKDGVIDVTNKWLIVKPQDMELFGRESSISDSQGVSVGGAKIISVMREANADGASDVSTAWESCRKIPLSMQSRAVDVDSLHFASIYNPVYTVSGDKTINVYPIPSSDNGFKIFYVNEEPRDITNNAALIHSHADIKYFPNDKVYLVVMYAGIKVLQASLGDVDISTFSSSAIAPTTPSLPSISGGSVSAITIDSLPDPPVYIKQEQTFDTAQFETFLETEEDTELAQMQLGRLNNELSQYQANIQNELNNFNKANTEYQATIQRNLQQAQINMQDAQKEADLTLQAAIQDYTLEVQKYQADLQKYQADITKDVQGYQQEIAEKSSEYQWKVGRLTDLKNEYMQCFVMASPGRPGKGD